MWFGKQTYAVHVAPGVDMALMAALCVCLDEKRSEDKEVSPGVLVTGYAWTKKRRGKKVEQKQGVWNVG
jgi:hypothetical protein